MMQWTWKRRHLFNILFSFPLNIYLELWLLGYMVVLFLIFWGTSLLLSIVAAPIYIPTTSAQGFPFCHMLAAPVISCLLDDCHSHRCEVELGLFCPWFQPRLLRCGFPYTSLDLDSPGSLRWWRCGPWVLAIPTRMSGLHLFVFTIWILPWLSTAT